MQMRMDALTALVREWTLIDLSDEQDSTNDTTNGNQQQRRTVLHGIACLLCGRRSCMMQRAAADTIADTDWLLRCILPLYLTRKSIMDGINLSLQLLRQTDGQTMQQLLLQAITSAASTDATHSASNHRPPPCKTSLTAQQEPTITKRILLQ